MEPERAACILLIGRPSKAQQSAPRFEERLIPQVREQLTNVRIIEGVEHRIDATNFQIL